MAKLTPGGPGRDPARTAGTRDARRLAARKAVAEYAKSFTPEQAKAWAALVGGPSDRVTVVNQISRPPVAGVGRTPGLFPEWAWKCWAASGTRPAEVSMPTLLDALADVPDPRDPRGLIHPLPAVLALAVVAMLAGMTSLEAVAQFGRLRPALAFALGFRRARTPNKSALSKLFRRLDPARVEAALGRWLAARGAADGVVCLDGKTLRGSAAGGLPGAHLLAAYAPGAAAVLGQVRVDAKTNEHKAALGLIGVLPLRGKVVTADAMFTHRDVCAAVAAAGGDYVLPVKDNQPGLRADVAAAFDDAACSPLRA